MASIMDKEFVINLLFIVKTRKSANKDCCCHGNLGRCFLLWNLWNYIESNNYN